MIIYSERYPPIMSKQALKEFAENDTFSLVGVWVKFFKRKDGYFSPICSQRLQHFLKEDECQYLLDELPPFGKYRKYQIKEMENKFVNSIAVKKIGE